MTLVKICGLRDPESATAAITAGADMVGLVFAASRRQVSPQECHDVVEAVRAARRTPPPATFESPLAGEVRGLSWYGAWSEAVEQALWQWRPLVVGIFAGQTVAEVNDIADAAGLDLVQLSGGEPPEFARAITRPVIKVLHVAPGDAADDVLDAAPTYRAAAILLDTGGKGAAGGTGTAFDWDVAAEAGRRLPVILAGGLTPENVAEAVEQTGAWAVDVSSGVETDGRKDPEKIRAFIRAAKGVARVQ